MNFLSRFSQARNEPPVAEEMPARRRTFSASQYRDEEIARLAELRKAEQAAQAEVAAAAEAARALRLAEVDEERVEALEDAGYPPAPSAGPPMDWEEACGWLSMRSPEARNFVAMNWNWEQDLRVLQFLVQQPDVDMGVATGIFWLTGATDDFFPWGDDDSPDDPQFARAADMVDTLGRRFAAEDFQSARFGFDDSWDCSGLKDRLEALYMDGRIEWSPANLPTVSPGPQPTIEDVPEHERREVMDFLARHAAF